MDARRGHYAHSTDRADRSDWQPLAEHLHGVAELAAIGVGKTLPRLEGRGGAGDAG